MVRAYVGTRKIPTGSGKTLSMMYDIRKFLLQKSKIKYNILSNTQFLLREKKMFGDEVEFEAQYIKDKDLFIDTMCKVTNTIILIDELSAWFDARNWKMLPKEFDIRIKQYRKVNVHLLYTAQNFKHVDLRVQQFTNVIVECSPTPKPDIESFAPPPSPIWIRQYWRHPDYFETDVQAAIRRDPKMEGDYTYKKRTIYLSELKRTFPTFDTYEIT